MHSKTSKNQKVSESWDIKPISTSHNLAKFSADDVIQAYFSGKKSQQDADISLRKEKFEQNLSKAVTASESLFQEITSMGFKCSSIHLKFKNIYRFSSIFIIDQSQYCSDKFLDVYMRSIEIKKELNTSDTFDFSVLFTPANEYFDLNSLVADGYVMSYYGGEKKIKH